MSSRYLTITALEFWLSPLPQKIAEVPTQPSQALIRLTAVNPQTKKEISGFQTLSFEVIWYAANTDQYFTLIKTAILHPDSFISYIASFFFFLYSTYY